MLDIARMTLHPGPEAKRFPAERLRFEQKRLKLTVVAVFEIDSNERRDEIETTIEGALSALGGRSKLQADYEVIG